MLTSEMTRRDTHELQDTCAATPPSISTAASSCCPRDRPDLNGWQVTPQLYSALGWAATRGHRVVAVLLRLPSGLPE